MRAVAVGLLVEEQRGEIAAAWKRAVEHELGGEPALAFAVGPLLREMGLALRGDQALAARAGIEERSGTTEGALRSAVLVRSGASPSRVAREFKLLHRALWDTLRAAGHIVAADERRSADEWLDEALAATLDRLDRVRLRIDLLERSPAAASATAAHAAPIRPPPLPRDRVAAPPAAPPTVIAPAGATLE